LEARSGDDHDLSLRRRSGALGGARRRRLHRTDRLDAFVADTYWPALHAAAAGTPIARPDVVVRPRTEEEVAEVVAIADRHRTPVVPWGGGSGTQAAACRSTAVS